MHRDLVFQLLLDGNNLFLARAELFEVGNVCHKLHFFCADKVKIIKTHPCNRADGRSLDWGVNVGMFALFGHFCKFFSDLFLFFEILERKIYARKLNFYIIGKCRIVKTHRVFDVVSARNLNVLGTLQSPEQFVSVLSVRNKHQLFHFNNHTFTRAYVRTYILYSFSFDEQANKSCHSQAGQYFSSKA